MECFTGFDYGCAICQSNTWICREEHTLRIYQGGVYNLFLGFCNNCSRWSFRLSLRGTDIIIIQISQIIINKIADDKMLLFMIKSLLIINLLQI